MSHVTKCFARSVKATETFAQKNVLWDVGGMQTKYPRHELAKRVWIGSVEEGSVRKLY